MTVTHAPGEVIAPRIVTYGVEPVAPKTERLASLDIFRGITIAAMLLVNNPGSWANKYAPLGHAKWDGWTPTDFVFPFFLFIVGVAIPFSMAKRAASVGAKSELLAGIWARALSLVLLGLLLHSVPIWEGRPLPVDGYYLLKTLRVVAAAFVAAAFLALLFPWKSKRLSLLIPPIVALLYLALYWAISFANRNAIASGLGDSFALGSGILTPYKIRFPGVLQRIGVCYGVAATIALFGGKRTILSAAVVLMALYSVLMLAVPFRDHVTGSLTSADNLARHIDVAVFGAHNYGEYPDPEGLLSTLPAIASVLLGILVGLRLRSDRPPIDKAASVLSWGVITACIGVLLGWWLMPINKQIWTPSFTVFTAGMAMLGLGTVFYVADVHRRRAWALPFKIYGMNAIAAFVLAGLLGRLLGLIHFAHPRTGDETTPIPWLKSEIAVQMDHLSSWLTAHVSPQLAGINSANNVSLAYALTFVLVVLLVMTLLYVCRIFIKV